MPKRTTQITTIRIDGGLLAAVGRAAAGAEISRNRMIELVLKDFVSTRGDADLRRLAGTTEGEPDATTDLFA